MGKTQTKKIEARTERLSKLPRSDRLQKQALIKKKEGRVLDAAEKHALMMTSEYGEALKLWEVLRTIGEDGVQGLSEAQEKRLKKRSRVEGGSKDKTAKFGEDDDEEEGEVATEKKGRATLTTAERAAAAAAKYEHKYATIDRLFKIIEPKFATLCRTPRMSRVIQSMIKYGSPAQLEKITTLLSTDFATFCNDGFASYVVVALLRHAPHALFRKILTVTVAVMPKLVTHAYGLRVVSSAYSSRLCSATDRNHLMLGCFKDDVAIMKHWRGYPVLEDILQQEKTYQKRMLSTLYTLVDKLINPKEAAELPFVQRLATAFLMHGTKHEIMDLAIVCKPKIITVLKEGNKEASLFAAYVFTLLEPKYRKDPLRQISENFMEFASGKFTSPVVARMFDLVYDAQLLSKYMVAPLVDNMREIISSPYAHLILVHLFTPSGERKERLLPPYFSEYNLYSTQNNDWNVHNWLDADYKEETVEICSKPAQKTHLSVLKPIVAKFNEVVVAGLAQETKGATQEMKHFRQYAVRLARELVNVVDTDALYKEVVVDAGVDIEALRALMPIKTQDGDAEVEVADAKPLAAAAAPAKKAATSAPVAASATSKAPVKTPKGKRDRSEDTVEEKPAPPTLVPTSKTSPKLVAPKATTPTSKVVASVVKKSAQKAAAPVETSARAPPSNNAAAQQLVAEEKASSRQGKAPVAAPGPKGLKKGKSKH